MPKKPKKEEKSYRSGEVMTMFESLKDGIKLVAEQHGGLVRKIDENHKEFREFRKEVNYEFAKIGQRFDGIDANLKVALEYLFRIDEELQNIKAEISELKKTLKNKGEESRIIDLEKRVKILEKEIFTYRKQILANRS